MHIMLFLLSLISFLLTFVSGSPVMHARQTTFAPLPFVTPTACPATDPVTATWIPAATNIAAIPKGLLTDCQLGCLANTGASDSNCDQATEYWTYCFRQPNITSIGQCLCEPPIYYQAIFEDCAGCLATAQYLANLAHPPARPAPDFFNETTGLVVQLTTAYLDLCDPLNPVDITPESLEHFLCETRDITEIFGGPIAMMNFTLRSDPSLAWNGYGTSPDTLPFSPLPSPTSRH
ncbi:hypothetical protein N431DRAFT_142314 [Stipitochalara longipes BDJ]|nr:hypothetical protein N431DRAFT_142314 [Stipitochalara longipes BDJ]